MRSVELLKQDLSDDFILSHKDEINPNDIIQFRKLSERLVEAYRIPLNWCELSRIIEPLSDEFVIKHKDELLLNDIVIKRLCSLDAIDALKHKLDWKRISKYQMSIEFASRFQNKIHWDVYFRRKTISTTFVRKFHDRIPSGVKICGKFSEKFIREFPDVIDWDNIKGYDKFSDEFLLEFSKQVNWGRVTIYRKMTEELIAKFNRVLVWKFKSYSEIKHLPIEILAMNVHRMSASTIEQIDFPYSVFMKYCDENTIKGFIYSKIQIPDEIINKYVESLSQEKIHISNISPQNLSSVPLIRTACNSALNYDNHYDKRHFWDDISRNARIIPDEILLEFYKNVKISLLPLTGNCLIIADKIRGLRKQAR